MRAAWLGLGLLLSGPTIAQNVLNNSTHVSEVIVPSLIILLGASPPMLADATSLNNLPVPDIVVAATDAVRTNYQTGTTTPRNSAPYAVTSSPFTGWTLANQDQAQYAAMIEGGIVNNWAFVPLGPQPVGTPPPVAATNVTHQAGTTSGWGIEFGVSTGYKGLDTASPSSTTSVFSAMLAAARSLHPTWTWPDIKAALRQTASNWGSGYDPTQFGYGFVDYDAAVALADTDALFLQAPNLVVSVTPSGALSITIYPYRQTRRAYEVVYLVPASYSFPMNDELTTADITASGGVLVYTSNGSDMIPTTTVTLQPGQFGGVYAGAWNLIGFTTDGAGAFSRVESFNQIGLTLVTNCRS